MQRRIAALIAIAMILACIHAGYARVTAAPANPSCGVATVTSLGNNTYDVLLDVNTAFCEDLVIFTVERTTANDRIRKLEVRPSVNVTTITEVQIGSATSPILSIDEIQNLAKTDGPVLVSSLFVSGDLGKVEVSELSGASVGGDLNGPVLLESKSNDLPPNLNIEVSGGVTGSIQIDDAPSAPGSIQQLRAVGRIGPGGLAGTKIDIVMGALGRIFDVRGAEINANIYATGSGENGYVREVRSLQTIAGAGGSGAFTGTVRVRSLATTSAKSEFVFGGDAKGDILVARSLADPSNRGNRVTVPASGLKGRIVINALNDSATWIAPVLVASTSVEPRPEYDDTAASLGGGSVGLVPFRLHRSDSFPVDAVTVNAADAPSTTSPIKLRHYGPVALPSGASPFIVDRRRAGTNDAWDIGHEACFTPSVDTTNSTIVLLTPSTKLQTGYEYRVTHAPSGGTALRCELVPGTVQVPSYTYTFTICGDTLGDADDSLAVNFNDITTVLANFGSNGCLILGDADRNGEVNFNDMTTVLANFGNEYCTSNLLRLATGEPKHGPAHGHAANESGAIMSVSTAAASLSSALLSMGYESIDAFVGTISQMSEADRNAEVQRLGQLLEAGQGGVD